MRIKVNIIIFILTIVFFNVTRVYAINMDSTRYRIQYGNVNMGAENMIGNGFNLSTTLGQLSAGEFSRNGYVIRAGFQYIHTIIPFTFTISDTNINLGFLRANTPATDSAILTVSFGGAGQYTVTVIEKTPLMTLSGENKIDDTSCDNTLCSATLAKSWTSNTAYGFGYSMSGEDTPSDFINSNYYRPFSDESSAKPPVVIMNNTNVTQNFISTPKNRKQSIITFKANVSPLQAAGTYQTIISFVAVPSF